MLVQLGRIPETIPALYPVKERETGDESVISIKSRTSAKVL